MGNLTSEIKAEKDWCGFCFEKKHTNYRGRLAEEQTRELRNRNEIMRYLNVQNAYKKAYGEI